MNPFWSPDTLPERERDAWKERVAILHADRVPLAEERATCEWVRREAEGNPTKLNRLLAEMDVPREVYEEFLLFLKG